MKIKQDIRNVNIKKDRKMTYSENKRNFKILDMLELKI